MPAPYLVYVVASLLVIFSYPLPARPLLSDPRFLIVLFPVFWAMVDLWQGRLFAVILSILLGRLDNARHHVHELGVRLLSQSTFWSSLRAILSSHLALMLLVTFLTFGAGVVQKAPCMTRSWVEDEKFVPFLCDTDIPHLLAWEQLASGRLPYVDRCAPAARPCDEYPPGTMYLMKGITSVIGSGGDPYLRFSWLGMLALLASALWTTWSLERMGARTSPFFAASPVLLTAGALNWDLVAVGFATAATLRFLRQRDIRCGALLGIGTIVKVYPGPPHDPRSVLS